MCGHLLWITPNEDSIQRASKNYYWAYWEIFQVTVGHHDLAIYHKHKYYRQIICKIIIVV